MREPDVRGGVTDGEALEIAQPRDEVEAGVGHLGLAQAQDLEHLERRDERHAGIGDRAGQGQRTQPREPTQRAQPLVAQLIAEM